MNLVSGVGPPDAKICIVGEAWGLNEARAFARTGRHTPFCGQAGEELDKLLHTAGIMRSEVYVTNVVREQPPNNNIETFIKFGKGGVLQSATPEYYK